MTAIKILALTINLNTYNYLVIKKKTNFKFLKKKIYFNNIKVYGTYILLNKHIFYKNVIPIAVLTNNIYLSVKKHTQLLKYTSFTYPSQLFIKSI